MRQFVRHITRQLPRTAWLMIALWIAGSPAVADQLIPRGDGWQTYINDRFGMQFDIPGDFQPAAPPENGDGRSFDKGDASIYIFARDNTEGDTFVCRMRGC